MINDFKPVKEKIGHMDCRGCGKEVAVHRNTSTGALSFPCTDCGAPLYAKRDGTDWYNTSMARVRPLVKEAPAHVPMDTSTTTPAPAPVPKSKATIFG